MRESRIPTIALRLLRSPLGRIVSASVGLALIIGMLTHVGWRRVVLTLGRAAPLFPLVLLLEAAIVACSMCALRLLYEDDRHRLPTRALISAGLTGYAVMGFLPAGRAFGEAARAAHLARYSTAPRAWAAAVRLQGVALVANAAISGVAIFAVFHLVGISALTLLLMGNGVITVATGSAILLAGSRSKVGSWTGERIPRALGFGREFDSHLVGGALFPLRPFLWELTGRVIQVVQNGVLVVAAGGVLGLGPALGSEAIHLVGSAAGDLIPAQLGATEAGFELSSRVLSLKPSEAVSIALLAHLAQLVWISIGLLLHATGRSGRLQQDFPGNPLSLSRLGEN
jgi:hypothetical protein